MNRMKRSLLGLALSVTVGAAVAGAVLITAPAERRVQAAESQSVPLPETLLAARRIMVEWRTEDGPRPFPVALWYPADRGPATQMVGDGPLLTGVAVRLDAPPQAPLGARLPLVLLSHGSGGNMTNQAWLARDLVEAGYVVASLTHPGSTTGDSSPQKALALWQRPGDLSAALDAVLKDPQIGPLVDPSRIAAVGHSLGGYTVLAAGGARLDREAYRDLCRRNPKQGDCAYFLSAGLSFDSLDRAKLEGSYRDPRIKAVVAMSPAFAQAFAADSLAAWPVPLLVVGLTGDELLPHAANAAALAARIPGAKLLEQPGGHFSVLPDCKPGGKALLAQEPDPSDRFLCDDAGQSRAQVHQQVSAAVRVFLKDTGV
ncbi:alpha/beta hydrolase family protein [Novispirillum itersonii]|uniref:Putative dienelactone hydrolase n=1 Tax=Novispirillum itersonii TaxID=189 RepID=A0A7X0DLZ2_NOVIT|nr:hypothetical protein [Novispirillum itersonii]MBB6210451.1 putative dienelactone hydrolase [Novispirillum itersonii]